MGTPTHEELCKVAYRLWEERGCPDGSPEVDWERAEQECGRPGAGPRITAGSQQRTDELEGQADSGSRKGDRRLNAATAP